MTTTALTNAQILLDGELVDGRAVHIRDGHILDITDEAQADRADQVHDLAGGVLAPGFIDTQVNGGGGVLFNDDPTPETIATIAQAHRGFGTTGLLPTLISDRFDVMAQAISAIDSAIKSGAQEVLGVHLEGPFLNVEKKGVHDANMFRTLTPESIALLTSLQSGRTLITLAPECAEPSVISELRARGAVLSAGHTNTDFATTRAALEAGVTGFTHLFNAMSPLTSREPGVVGAALADQSSWCGLIVDGHHVSPETLKIALKCKPLEKFMLVTDAMPSVGASAPGFKLQGRPVIVRDGKCLTEDGTLAGSDLNMVQAVLNTTKVLEVPLPRALEMASLHPAAFLGIDDQFGRIAPGYRADLVSLDPDLGVKTTWIAGSLSLP